MQTTSLRFADISSLIRLAFPEAKSRRPVHISFRKNYNVSDYWDGGSRTYTAFVDLHTMQAISSQALPKSARQVMSNPFNLPIGEVILSNNHCVIEHSIFCGKDMGYRIIFCSDVKENILEIYKSNNFLNGIESFYSNVKALPE